MPTTTVSSTPCWRAAERLALACGLALLLASGARAEEAEAQTNVVQQATIRYTEAGPVLDAKIAITLTPSIADALARGITQPFVAELEIERPRNWWFDADVLDASRRVKLGYNLLLRTWVVDTDTRSRNFSSLGQAIAALGTIEGWLLPGKPEFVHGEHYAARLRLRIDTQALPKPMIIGAFTSDKWELATPWHHWEFDGPSAAP